MKVKLISFLPAFIWFIFIFVLLTLPANDFPQDPVLDEIDLDKFVHIGLFSVLVVLVMFPFKNYYPQKVYIFLLIPVMALFYGIGMEYVQKYYTLDRSFEVNDMIADGIGAFIGYAFTLWRFKKIKPL